MKVELEKLENYKGVAVRALLDSRATSLFMDITFAIEKGFKIEKLKNPLCYESPKQEKVSHTFEHLIQNPKAYNGVRI